MPIMMYCIVSTSRVAASAKRGRSNSECLMKVATFLSIEELITVSEVKVLLVSRLIICHFKLNASMAALVY